MRRIQRQFAQTSFAFLVGVGTLLFATAVFGLVRGAAVLIDASQALSGQSAASACGCASTTAPSIGTLISGSSLLVLSLGVVVMAVLRLVVLTRRTRKLIRSFTPHAPSPKLAALAASLGVSGRTLEVAGRQSDIFCAGAISPRLFVSRQAVESLEADELRVVLEHERFHLRQRHPLKILLVDLFTSSLRFLPFVARAVSEYRTAIELAADETVLERQESSQHLSAALLKLLPHGPIQPVAAAVTFFGTTERRIDQLLGQPESRRRRSLLLTTFVLVGLALIAVAGTVSARVGTLTREAKESVAGQCHETQRQCQATTPSWRMLMTSEAELVSSQ